MVAQNKDMALFEELFKESPEIKYPKQGEIISGKIIKIEKKNILVNVNNQFTGLVVSKEVGNTIDLNELKPGQQIEVMVLGDSVERGLLILSLKRANQIKNLTNLTKYNESNEFDSLDSENDGNSKFLWIDINDLNNYDIQPKVLIEKIQNKSYLVSGVERLISK